MANPTGLTTTQIHRGLEESHVICSRELHAFQYVSPECCLILVGMDYLPTEEQMAMQLELTQLVRFCHIN